MSQNTNGHIDIENLTRTASTLYQERLDQEKNYARLAIHSALRKNEDANRKEKRSARHPDDVTGALTCLEGLEDIVTSACTHILIPELPEEEKLPRYTAWIPITRDFLFQEKEDVLTRYPSAIVGLKGFRSEEFGTTLREYGEFWKKSEYNMRTMPSVQEIEDITMDEVPSVDEHREFLVRASIISEILKPIGQRRRFEFMPALRAALEVDPFEDMDELVKLAFAEEKERTEEITRVKTRAQTSATIRSALIDHSASCIPACSPDELVDQVLGKYCPLCHIMNCQLHSDEMYKVTPVKPIIDQFVEKRQYVLMKGKPSACSVSCYMLIRKPQLGKVQTNELKEWTQEEDALLEMCVPVYQEDPCSLAIMVGTRTCREVFMKLIEPSWCTWSDAAIEIAKQPRRVRRKDPLEDWRVEEGVNDHFVPCNHEGPCTRKVCTCIFLGYKCEASCACNNVRCCEGPTGFGICEAVHHTQRLPIAKTNRISESGKCPNLWQGCYCKPGKCDKYCPCSGFDKPCKPGLCSCMSTTAKCARLITGKCTCKAKNGKCAYIPCRNVFISAKKAPRTRMGKSPVHGYGLFATEYIRRGDIIGIYTGQLMSQYISEILAYGYDEHDHTFLFDWTEFITSDATIMGSLMKFINHASSEKEGLNCYSKKQVTNGVPIIAYFATRNIKPGDELFIDYKFTNSKPAWMKKNDSSE